MKKLYIILLLSIMLSSLVFAGDRTIFIPMTTKNYNLNMTNVSENYVPYTNAITDLDLGVYSLTAGDIYGTETINGLNIYSNNGLFVTRGGIPQIEFINTEGTEGTGISIVGKVNRADAIQTYYPTGKIEMDRTGTWSGTDSRNYNSYMTFSTLTNKGLTEKMRITQKGYVGIGTTEPKSELDVRGYIYGSSGVLTDGWFETYGGDYTSNGWIGLTYDLTSQDTATYFGMQQYAGDNLIDLYTSTSEFTIGTDYSDEDKFKIVVGYGLDSFDNNNFVMNNDGDIYIEKNLNVNGILTYNNFYAEGYYYNSTGGGTPYTIDLVTTNTNYNLTNWTTGEYNGFTFEGNGVTANYNGVYQLSGSITFTAGNDEYSFTMSKDNVPVPKCGMGLTATSSMRNNVALTCLVELNAGEHLNLQVMDKNTPVTDVDIYKVNLNIVKVSG